MTRQCASKPVWTWSCDRCGSTSGDLAHTQDQLPSVEEMRKRGWYIADLSGDLCSRCHNAPEILRGNCDASD